MQNQRSIEADGGDEILYHITDGIAGAIGEEFFRSLTRHLADALQVRYSFVTESPTKREHAFAPSLFGTAPASPKTSSTHCAAHPAKKSSRERSALIRSGCNCYFPRTKI